MPVPQRVLLLHTSTLGLGSTLCWANNGLYFGAVDQAGDVCVGDQVGWEQEVFLERRRGGGAAVDGVKSSERRGRPHDESAEVPTWCELKEVEREYGAGLNTRNVAERADEMLAISLRVINDQWPATLTVAATSHFPLTGTEFAGGLDFADVWTCTDGFEESEGCGGLDDGSSFEGGGGDDKGNFGDGRDLVTTGKEKGWD